MSSWLSGSASSSYNARIARSSAVPNSIFSSLFRLEEGIEDVHFFLAFVLHRVIVRRSLTFWPDESSYAKLGLEIGCIRFLNRDRADP